MEIINNIDNLLGENLKLEVRKGSNVSIAASCFSIYAYEALIKELNQVEEVRFIFTSPKRNRKKSLYGTEFEIQLKTN